MVLMINLPTLHNCTPSIFIKNPRQTFVWWLAWAVHGLMIDRSVDLAHVFRFAVEFGLQKLPQVRGGAALCDTLS